MIASIIDPDLEIPERIALLIEMELSETEEVALARDMRKVLCAPREVEVLFSGGITQLCWQVTRSDGDYSVVYLPRAGYFALCVDSIFGPVDIGVHGPALGCFGSV